MKIRYHDPQGPPGPPPGTLEELITEVVALDHSVLLDVNEASCYSLVPLEGTYSVLLQGRGNAGVLDQDAAAWVAGKRIVRVLTDGWSAEPGSEYLTIRIIAEA